MWPWTFALMVLAFVMPAAGYVLKAPVTAPATITHERALHVHGRRSHSPRPTRPKRASRASMKMDCGCGVVCSCDAAVPGHEHETERHVSWVSPTPESGPVSSKKGGKKQGGGCCDCCPGGCPCCESGCRC